VFLNLSLVNHQGQHEWQNGETTMANVLTLEEVASYLRVHPSTIYRLLKKKQLPAFKVGSDWRFNVESIDRWRAEAEDSEPEMKIMEV
jgi:excisionase family DNA binding protein